MKLPKFTRQHLRTFGVVRFSGPFAKYEIRVGGPVWRAEILRTLKRDDRQDAYMIFYARAKTKTQCAELACSYLEDI